MICYKHNETGEVYAYEQSDIDKVNQINAGNEDGIDSVFFKIRDNLANCTKMAEAEVDAHLNPVPTPEQLADTARAERDRLIESFRWRIERHSDELALGIEPTDALEPLLQYVQDLRDVPQQEGFPETIEWPEVPNERTKLD